MNQRYPTVNDLRVRVCYVCREEERHDEPQNPPKPWVHPCNCTLIAHESCLLQWIQTAQADPARAPKALKCPQCETQYEIESNNPLILRIITTVNKSLQVVGRMFTVCAITGVVLVFGTGMYIVSTAYGAYAVQELLGKEMFDLLLTEDPSNWPWHAFFNLPLVPLSLIMSRTSIGSRLFSTMPLFLTWSTTTPIALRERSFLEHWTRTENMNQLRSTGLPPLATWPPSPIMVSLFLFPITRFLYRKYFTQFAHWVLGSRPEPAPPTRRRFIWALNDGGGPLNIRIGANIEAGNPPAPALRHPLDQAANGVQNAAAAAEETISSATFSLGRLVGGALLIPAISNFMGSLLFRLSHHSPLLRKFLAVRPPLNGQVLSPAFGRYSLRESWTGLGSKIKEIGQAMRVALGLVWGGTRTWAECDPVWWRNSLGLGLFIVAKDCIHLFHLWLTKRELESRRVKDRSFENVDINELDLINPS